MIINYIHWDPNPEIINIFGITIRYSELLFVSGLILSTDLLGWIFKRENIPYNCRNWIHDLLIMENK
jgi:prolipoprotein diacylglyceryltransferase